MSDEVTDRVNARTSRASGAGSPSRLPAPVHVAGTTIHPVTRVEAGHLVVDLAGDGRGHLVVTPNVDHVVLLQDDEDFAAAYDKAALRICDGMPLVVLSRLAGDPLPERVTGADLFLDVCALAAAHGLKVFIAGGMPDVLEVGLRELRRRFPELDVTGHSPPLHFEGSADDEDLRRRIAAEEADIVMVCLGAPRAEIWASKQVHTHPAVYLCVGAAIDFVAGARRRAPKWVQSAGLEWAFRLLQEPRRLWRRYIVRDSAFVPIAVRDVIRGRSSRSRHRREAT